MLESLLLLKALAFAALMAGLFLIYPAIRRKRRAGRPVDGSQRRFAEGGSPREEYEE